MSDKGERRASGWMGLAIAGVAGIAIGALVMLLLGGGIGDERIKRVVREALLEQPEILPEAMAELNRKEAAAAIGPRRAEFETPYQGAWAGAEDGDVVLVEFFDYACGYCRQSNAAIDRLLAEDPRLKVVWRELPVLGPASQEAALASLAAADQRKFRPFYQAVFAAGRPTPDTIRAAMAQAGVQPAAPSQAHQTEIQRNVELASLVRASGTPTFVVGEKIFHGAVPYEQLKEAIDEARARSRG